MQVFPWSPSFETNVGEVDAQHRRLVELINGLGALLVEGGEVPPPVLARTIEDLRAYACYHFDEEERLMEQAGVDPRYQEGHRREHQLFREYVAAAIGSGATGGGEATPLLTYLVHWLTYHILGADQGLVRQINAIRAGTSPAEALAREGSRDDPVSRLLLRSVGELFALLSGRNRELMELNRTLERRVGERTQALTEANDELLATMARVERMAMTDSLTELPNRRHAMTWLAGAWAAAARHGRPLSCLLIDADGFKQVNDTTGHEAGDRVLVQLARVLRAGARESDEVCRLGGDEFLVICPETPLEGALSLGERMRAAVAGLRVELEGGRVWSGSISVGAAAMREGMKSFEELLGAADAGVYEAKRQGRNRVAAVAPPQECGGVPPAP
jgi:hemerythrin